MDISTYIFLQEVLAWSASLEKISLKNLKNPQKITFTRIFFFGKFQAAILFKKRLRQSCFAVKFAKFVRTPFLQNTSGGMLLIKIFVSTP